MFVFDVVVKNKSFSLFNCAGFALFYVMGLASIVTIIVVLSLGYFSANQKSRDNILNKTMMETVVQNLRSQLNEGTACPSILGSGLNTVTLGANAITNINLNYSMQGGSGSVISAGWTFDNKIVISRVELRVLNPALSLKNGTTVRRGNAFGPVLPYFPVRLSQSANWPLPWAIGADSLTLDKYLAEIRFIPEGFPFNFSDLKNTIRLYIKVTPAGKIIQCHGEISEAESCESRGLSYDGIYAPAKYRCNPDFYCRKDNQFISTSPVCSPPYKTQLLSYEASSGNRLVQCAWCNP